MEILTKIGPTKDIYYMLKKWVSSLRWRVREEKREKKKEKRRKEFEKFSTCCPSDCLVRSRKSQKMGDLYTLDFDGVLRDSYWESSLYAIKVPISYLSSLLFFLKKMNENCSLWKQKFDSKRVVTTLLCQWVISPIQWVIEVLSYRLTRGL